MILEKRRTKLKATPIPNASPADVETANTGHSPRSRTKIGFSKNIPLRKTSVDFFTEILYYFPYFLTNTRRKDYSDGERKRRKMIKIGVVNIDISHPRSFATILQKENQARYTGIYNDGFRTDEEVEEFIKKFNLERRYDNIEELAKAVDIVFVQGCNWDKHLELAESVIKIGKPVFIDKPIVGNLADCVKLENLVKEGAVILGSSSVRYAQEFVDIRKTIEENNEEIVSVFGTAGVDEFNYGVHIMEGIQGFLGSGADSVRFIGSTVFDGNIVEHYFTKWKDGVSVIYQTQTPQWQPFEVVITTTKNIHHFRVDSTKIYKAMLDRICDFMEKGTPMTKITDLTETIKIYLAGKESKENRGEEIKLIDLKTDKPGFDGDVFEKGYAAKNGKKK